MAYFIVSSAPWERRVPAHLARSPLSLLGGDVDPDDLFLPAARELQALLSHPEIYSRAWQSKQSEKDAGSTVAMEKDRFQVNLDVQQFRPEEISVKVTGDNTITVEGRHEEKPDDHGFISRHFVRRYVLPKGHDISKVASKLSSDGVLTIVAPKEGKEQVEHRSIPIRQTGQPTRSAVEQKSDASVEQKKPDEKKE